MYYISAGQTSLLLNASYKEQKLPSVWKVADVTPLPKVKKELRPISLTPALSKIAEDFIVSDYIKPALKEKVAPNQFGTITGSSTVMAFISMVHKWSSYVKDTNDFLNKLDIPSETRLQTLLQCAADIPRIHTLQPKQINKPECIPFVTTNNPSLPSSSFVSVLNLEKQEEAKTT